MKFIKKFVRDFLYGKGWGQKMFKKLHRISLQGMNYGTDPKIYESGEFSLLNLLRNESENTKWTIFDVGANTGEYTKLLLEIFGKSALIYSFEPSPTAFKKLSETLGNGPVKLHNLGFGSKISSPILYTNEKGGGLASLYKRRLNHKMIKINKTERVQLETLDNFCKIDKINFLKLDTEGHELEILRGAKNFLKDKK